MGLFILIRDPRISSSPLTHEDSVRLYSQAGNRTSTDTGYAYVLIFDFPTFRMMRNIILILISHQACETMLQQGEETKTEIGTENLGLSVANT